MRENRLLTSAVYEIGLELQRLKAPRPPSATDLSSTANTSSVVSAAQPKSVLGKKRLDVV